MKENKLVSFIVILSALNIYLWFFALSPEFKTIPGFYFFDVGQGDSEMVVFNSGGKILTDAGPNFEIVSELQKVSGFSSNYIDLGIITHAQADHFGGFADLIKRYSFGAVLWNGVEPSGSGSWEDLKNSLAEQNIPLVITGAGTIISQGEDNIKILAPDYKLSLSKDMNDTGVVEKIELSGKTAIFAADISKKTETYLLQEYGNELKADIFKVPHHGSKTSAGSAFVSAVDPSISIIEVGLKNRYGHPTAEMLAMLNSVYSKILRTDLDGSLFLKPLPTGFEVFTKL